MVWHDDRQLSTSGCLFDVPLFTSFPGYAMSCSVTQFEWSKSEREYVGQLVKFLCFDASLGFCYVNFVIILCYKMTMAQQTPSRVTGRSSLGRKFQLLMFNVGPKSSKKSEIIDLPHCPHNFLQLVLKYGLCWLSVQAHLFWSQHKLSGSGPFPQDSPPTLPPSHWKM